MKKEVILYRQFLDNVLSEMNHNDIVTRHEIMYELGITEYLADKLLYYIKRNCNGYGFNKNYINDVDGYMIQFMKPNKFMKMYIVKL